MVALVRPVHPLSRVSGHVALVQLGRPYLLLPLRRLTDGPMLGEPRDPLGLDPVVIRPRLPGDGLQGFHRVESRETVLHGRYPKVVGQILGPSPSLHRLPVRGGA